MQDNAPGDMVANGEWEVSVNQEVTSEMAQVKFTDIDDEGVKQYVMFLTPKGCDDMADELRKYAEWIRENGLD